MNLVIVESPNKIKKISQILGNKFKIMASVGHFRDLPSENMAVNTNTFEAEYKITKPKVVSDLKKSIKNIKCIYIATDPDREGEGIAWHLIQVLNLKYPHYKRMTFTEITPHALQIALKKADDDGRLNQNMADAYQARRIIDRVIGYTISPFLWKRIQGAKSAGRVQSVATRLIIDKERLIGEHKSEEKYVISGLFLTENKEEFKGKLDYVPEKYEESMRILELCKRNKFSVKDVSSKIVWNSPPPAFKTSVYQQEVGKRFGLSPKQAMSVAQKLFEKGKITYHRTDITKLSDYFCELARGYIINKFGEDFVGTLEKKESKGNAQGAHEAIRPTDINILFLDEEEFTDIEKKVYKMIWVRAVASLMAKEKCQRFTANISFECEYNFVSSYLLTLFLGFKILMEKEQSEENKIVMILKEGDNIFYEKIESKQTFTEPPKRYTEASFVKELENKNIGRPSTFANIVDTIQSRKYVLKKNDSPIYKNCIINTLEKGNITSNTSKTSFGDNKKRLFPTELGNTVTLFLSQNLEALMSYSYTSDLENDLDSISEGKQPWKNIARRVKSNLDTSLASIPEMTEEEKEEKKQQRTDRVIGMFEGKKMEFFMTRYGPCIKHMDTWYNLDKNIKNANEVSEEIALKVIQEKRQNIIQKKKEDEEFPTFECELNKKEGTLKVAKGQYGYYLRFVPKKGKGTKNDNYFLPKDMKEDEDAIKALTLKEMIKIVENVQEYRKK